MINPAPGIIFFVLMWSSPGEPARYDFVEVPDAEQCSILVREAMLLNNEKLSGMKITAQCVTVVPQTWHVGE